MGHSLHWSLSPRLPRSSSSLWGLLLMVSSLTFTRWCSTPSLEGPFAARVLLLCCIFSCSLRWEERGLFRGRFLQRQSMLTGGSGVWRSNHLSGCIEMQWEMLRGRGGLTDRAKGKAICPLPGRPPALSRGIRSQQRLSKLALMRT